MTDENSSPSEEGNLDTTADTEASVSKDEGSTVLDTKSDTVTMPSWPEDWRNQFAGEDEKALKRMGRFKAPADVAKSYMELEKKLSSGQYKRGLPKDATEEDVAAWRKENGVPEKFDEYYNHLRELKIGDEDKPLFDDFFENVIHKHNLPPDAAKDVADWYYSLQQARQDEQHELDNTQRKEAEDALREEWGPDFRSNINVVNNLLSRAPEDIREGFANARLPDGRALFNSPEFMSFMAGLEREINPAASLTPNTSNPGQGVEDRIGEIEKFMRTNRKAYNSDERMQGELRQLYSAREKLQKRAS